MDWKAPFRRSGSNEADFTKQFVAFIQDRHPTVRASVVGPLAVDITLADDRVIRADLSHDWYDCKKDRPKWGQAFESLLQSIAELDHSQGIQIEAIVPLIRDQAFMDQAMRSAGGRKAAFKSEHLAADLWIIYAEDTQSGWKYVPDRHPLSVPELRQRAIERLRTILPGVQRQGNGPCYMLTADEHLTASLLLLDTIWELEAGHVEGELIAAVPTRYAILFTGSASPRDVATLKAGAQDAWNHGIDRLSMALLVRRSGRWEHYPESTA